MSWNLNPFSVLSDLLSSSALSSQYPKLLQAPSLRALQTQPPPHSQRRLWHSDPPVPFYRSTALTNSFPGAAFCPLTSTGRNVRRAIRLSTSVTLSTNYRSSVQKHNQIILTGLQRQIGLLPYNSWKLTRLASASIPTTSSAPGMMKSLLAQDLEIIIGQKICTANPPPFHLLSTHSFASQMLTNIFK